MKLAKIVVTGAGGWVGGQLTSELIERKFEVHVTGCKPEVNGPWRSYTCVDFSHDDHWPVVDVSAMAGAEVLIHCAGHAHRSLETPEEVERFYSVNRDGSGRVVQLAKRAGIPRVVYLSSIGFYDWSAGCDFTEDGPLARHSAYAASKLDGESIFRNSGLDWRAVRLGTVFGRGDRANFAKLAKAMARKQFVIPGNGAARKSVLPVQLAAGLLADLALMPNPPYRLLNLALPHTPDLAEICAAFSGVCQLPPARRIPLPLLQGMAKLGDVAALVRPNFPLTSNVLGKLTTSTTVDVSRMLATFPDRNWKTFREYLEGCADYYRTVR
jgi:nucleoside-diphosphate-sugar epimerase